MSAHTPGPLHVEQPERFPFPILIFDASGNQVWEERRYAYGSKQNSVEEVMDGTCFKGEQRKLVVETNARQLADSYLRAAAPELLAALEAMSSHYSGSLDHQPHYVKMGRAAIAKATGEA